MKKGSVLENLEEKKFREIEAELEKSLQFKRGDYKKQYNKKDIVMAGGIAFTVMGEEANASEFFNFFLNILYGTLEFE